MRNNRFIIFILLFSCLLYSSPLLVESQFKAASFYLQNNDLVSAGNLYKEILKIKPGHVQAALKLSEIMYVSEGRKVSREYLKQFITEQKPTSIDTELIQEKIVILNSLFLNDESQSLFFQAKYKVQFDDCAGALNLLNSALSIDKDNANILQSKMDCEKKLGQIDNYISTLRKLLSIWDFSSKLQLENLEAQVYLKKFEEIFSGFGHISFKEAVLLKRVKLAYAVSLFETKRENEAWLELVNLLDVEKSKALHPIIYYYLGKIGLLRSKNKIESTDYLNRFISDVEHKENTLINGWDPYRSEEKIADIKKLLLELNQQTGIK